MKKIVTLFLAFAALLITSCEKEVVEKIIEVPVEVPVEVDTSDMPEGLKTFVANEQLMAIYNERVESFRTNPEIDMLIVSYGNSAIYSEPATLPMDVINFQGFARIATNQYELRSWYHMQSTDGTSYYEEADGEPAYNELFFDDTQYVYKIIQF